MEGWSARTLPVLAVGKRMLVCCTERLWYNPKNTKKAFKLWGRMVAWNCLKSQYRHFWEKKVWKRNRSTWRPTLLLNSRGAVCLAAAWYMEVVYSCQAYGWLLHLFMVPHKLENFSVVGLRVQHSPLLLHTSVTLETLKQTCRAPTISGCVAINFHHELWLLFAFCMFGDEREPSLYPTIYTYELILYPLLTNIEQAVFLKSIREWWPRNE